MVINGLNIGKLKEIYSNAHFARSRFIVSRFNCDLSDDWKQICTNICESINETFILLKASQKVLLKKQNCERPYVYFRNFPWMKQENLMIRHLYYICSGLSSESNKTMLYKSVGLNATFFSNT